MATETTTDVEIPDTFYEELCTMRTEIIARENQEFLSRWTTLLQEAYSAVDKGEIATSLRKQIEDDPITTCIAYNIKLKLDKLYETPFFLTHKGIRYESGEIKNVCYFTNYINTHPTVCALCADLRESFPSADISAAFHTFRDGNAARLCIQIRYTFDPIDGAVGAV